MELEPRLTRPSLRNRGRDRLIQDLIAKRSYTEASRLVDEKIQLEPQSADARYLKGVIASYQGKLSGAIEYFTKALQLDAHHTDAAICLSVLYNDTGRYDEARKVFEQANASIAQKRPGDDHAIDRKFSVKHLELADLYFRYRRYDEAIEEYTKSISLDPRALDTVIKRAKAYAKKGFVTRAIQELQNLRKDQPDFVPARIQLGLVHFSHGNILDAELEWENALEFDPHNKEIKSYLDLAKQRRITPQPGSL